MALSSSKKQSIGASKATPQAATGAVPHTHADLEKKVASLEVALARVQAELVAHCEKSAKEHASLVATCSANTSSSPAGLSVKVEEKVDVIWKWLRKDRAFRSVNPK